MKASVGRESERSRVYRARDAKKERERERWIKQRKGTRVSQNVDRTALEAWRRHVRASDRDLYQISKHAQRVMLCVSSAIVFYSGKATWHLERGPP